MKRVTGIGGIFFKAKDAPALQAWYKRHLGIDVTEWGGAIFPWNDPSGMTVWTAFPEDADKFDATKASFMINYRVEDLVALAAVLKEEGVTIHGELQDTEYGKFLAVIDPEGNQVELWEPPAGR
jgi:predicted enzyme related to lactoylglutathione lyase